ncbi:MAG: 23S rRNA (uracil(1939)-C(5))-methyltransferase RlmD, partial [Oscillospiraceae bacterium]
MLLNKNEIIDLQIDKISNDGNGIGHYNGMAIFVPFTAVGDHIKAKIVKTSKTYAFGIIDSITMPSGDRCTVDCSNFEKCGGCNFRHINYSAELTAKQLFIKDAFLRIGKIDLEPLSILPSPEQNRYRNKVQYPVSLANDGTVFAGFYAGRSHRIIPCNDCMLQPTHLNSILTDTCSLLQSLNISIYNECTNTGLVRHIYLRDGVYSDEVLLCLVINGSKLPFEAEFTDKISTMHPEIKTIVLNINKNNTNVVTGLTCKTIFGNGNISDTLCNV